MFTIKSYIDKSEISGIGVFCGERIHKGRIVWEYFPLIDITYTEEEWKELKRNLSSPSFKNIQNYSYKENNKYIVCMDNAQFMNHSIDSFNLSNTDDLKSMFATRDIEIGEELLCNYLEYSDSNDHHLKNLGLNKSI